MIKRESLRGTADSAVLEHSTFGYLRLPETWRLEFEISCNIIMEIPYSNQ